MSTTPHPSPLIPSAARAGLTFGLILVVMYTARILSLQVPLLQILYFFGVIIVPIVAYRGARAYRDYFYPTGPFKAGQGFSYVVLLHVSWPSSLSTSTSAMRCLRSWRLGKKPYARRQGGPLRCVR